MLERPDTHATNLAVPRLMLEAEIALERGSRPRRWRGWPSCAAKRACTRRRNGSSCARSRRPDAPAKFRRSSTSSSSARSTTPSRASCCARARMPKRSRASRTTRRACARTGRACRKATGCSRRSRARPRGASSQLGGDREAADILARSLDANWDSEPDAALCRVPRARRDAPARNRRALARRAQPGRVAALRARTPVRAAAAVGQGADVSRGEPRARQSLARARGAGRDAREARPPRRSRCALSPARACGACALARARAQLIVAGSATHARSSRQSTAKPARSRRRT